VIYFEVHKLKLTTYTDPARSSEVVFGKSLLWGKKNGVTLSLIELLIAAKN
jgi:hypothetical protein